MKHCCCFLSLMSHLKFCLCREVFSDPIKKASYPVTLLSHCFLLFSLSHMSMIPMMATIFQLSINTPLQRDFVLPPTKRWSLSPHPLNPGWPRLGECIRSDILGLPNLEHKKLRRVPLGMLIGEVRQYQAMTPRPPCGEGWEESHLPKETFAG